ncbi:MAG TPA: hypothetical protein VEH27_09090 [Methylomirabilota bacterium]|nr:hypothetical protein [Methylomirabilota bacterium]
MSAPKILYCHCAYTQVVPAEVKDAVLRKLCDSGVSFEAVADLCETSARRDPSLKQMADGAVKIAACYPRAVKWLFAAAGAPLNIEAAEVLNMRTQPAAEVIEALMKPELTPNVPAGKETIEAVAEGVGK